MTPLRICGQASGTTRRQFLQTSGAALPLLGGDVSGLAAKVLNYAPIISSNSLIRSALGAVDINAETISHNLTVGAGLLANDNLPEASHMVGQYLTTMLEGGSESSTPLDQDAVKSLCYFFNPKQEVIDTMPVHNGERAGLFEIAMRNAHDNRTKENRSTFTNDPGVLDFISRGNYCSSELQTHSVDEVAGMLFDALSSKFSVMHKAFVSVSHAAGVAARSLKGTSASSLINRVGNKSSAFRRVNSVNETHSSVSLKHPNIERMTDADMDQFDLSKIKLEVGEKKGEESEKPFYPLSVIYRFPVIEELRAALEFLDAQKTISKPLSKINNSDQYAPLTNVI
jgi:hypothetical protein